MVDLAGSERASQTGTVGKQFTEGVNINKSLTTLTRVIQQIVTKQSYVLQLVICFRFPVIVEFIS